MTLPREITVEYDEATLPIWGVEAFLMQRAAFTIRRDPYIRDEWYLVAVDVEGWDGKTVTLKANDSSDMARLIFGALKAEAENEKTKLGSYLACEWREALIEDAA